jgi:hypothetical protein
MMKVRELKGDARDLVDADRQRTKPVTNSVNRGSVRTRIDADLYGTRIDSDSTDADWAAVVHAGLLAGVSGNGFIRNHKPDQSHRPACPRHPSLPRSRSVSAV